MIQKGRSFYSTSCLRICVLRQCRATEISVVPNSNKCLQYPPDGALAKRTDSHLGGKRFWNQNPPRSIDFLSHGFLAGKRQKVMVSLLVKHPRF